ncbi:alpha-L-fucosidase [Nonomuraea sp. NPDC059194]|uniref:alpha-L-fucosidase n=1 Tax=Nonomuraea sp. NPDC059194 TaxID=3346764 RepID=UPI0036BBF604
MPEARGVAVRAAFLPEAGTAERALLLVREHGSEAAAEGIAVDGTDIVIRGLRGTLRRVTVTAFDGSYQPEPDVPGRTGHQREGGQARPGWRVPIGPGDDPVEMAALVRPTERQLAWHRLERTAFLHFGVNTFTGQEWGYGDEDPNLFHPQDLDTDQWARELKAAGFTLAILTVKHHDGFVLYPSAHTGHSVASSSWRDGKGDVLRNFTDSMRAHGLKAGVYLSPADEHAFAAGTFANGSPRLPREVGGLTLPATDYGHYMLRQLHEVLTGYGPIAEVWFDGSQGRIPAGQAEDYDFDSWYALIRHLAPEATIAVCGPDVRWVGNESGLAREDEWNVVPVTVARERVEVADRYDAADLGSRAALAVPADYLQWWPAEVDVSIRPGWFFHDDQRPKSVDELMDIYHESVGRGAVLLLNIPPDRRGRLAEADVGVLREWSARIERSYGTNLAPDLPVWEGDRPLMLDLPQPVTFDRIVLAEDLRHGQLVESLTVEAWGDDGWHQVAACGTVGAKRILLLPAPVTTATLRFTVRQARGPARVSHIGLHLADK